MFERFLSVHRVGSIPDVDLDISSLRRDELFNYTIDKYNLNKCCKVSALSVKKAKSVIRQVGALLDIEPDDVDTIAKLIPTVFYMENHEDKKTDMTVKETLECVPEFAQWQEIYPELFDIAIKLERLPDHRTIHAAGVLITSNPVVEVAPLIKPKKGEQLPATSLNLSDAESQKLVKYDFLGSSTLDVIQMCEEMTGYKFDIEFDNFDDKEVWKLIGSTYTTGLFQISSQTYKTRMPRLKPQSIEELAACLALLRGPCIEAGLDKKYMNIIEGIEEVELIHPAYDKATKDSLGIIIYQEQLMNMFYNMGMPMHEAYTIMKKLSKKDKEIAAKSKIELWNYAKTLPNMNELIFDRIYRMVEKAALYLFNKSHAVAYSLITYTTAFYKTYFPKEFLTATLTITYISGSADKKTRDAKLKEIVTDANRLGIRFLPPNIHKSKWEFTVEGDRIRIGLCALPSFSESAYNEICKCKPFNDSNSVLQQIEDTIVKGNCKISALYSLIMSGALGDRIETYLELCNLRNLDPNGEVKIHNHLVVEPYATDEEIEELMLGTKFVTSTISNLPSINYRNMKKGGRFITVGIILKINKRYDKKGRRYAYATLQTGDGVLESIVFSDILENHKKILKKGNKISFQAVKESETKCILRSAWLKE